MLKQFIRSYISDHRHVKNFINFIGISTIRLQKSFYMIINVIFKRTINLCLLTKCIFGEKLRIFLISLLQRHYCFWRLLQIFLEEFICWKWVCFLPEICFHFSVIVTIMIIFYFQWFHFYLSNNDKILLIIANAI